MPTRETLTDKTLSIDFVETEDEVRLEWRGKSNDREPGRFLVPILGRALERSEGGKRRVVLDFTGLEYMNSSTFTPLVKLLDQAVKGPFHVAFEYSKDRKWQSLSFSALTAFATPDGRVSVHAK